MGAAERPRPSVERRSVRSFGAVTSGAHPAPRTDCLSTSMVRARSANGKRSGTPFRKRIPHRDTTSLRWKRRPAGCRAGTIGHRPWRDSSRSSGTSRVPLRRSPSAAAPGVSGDRRTRHASTIEPADRSTTIAPRPKLGAGFRISFAEPIGRSRSVRALNLLHRDNARRSLETRPFWRDRGPRSGGFSGASRSHEVTHSRS